LTMYRISLFGQRTRRLIAPWRYSSGIAALLRMTLAFSSQAHPSSEIMEDMAPSTRQLANDLLGDDGHDNDNTQSNTTTTSHPWKQRVALSKAITLTESTNESMRHQANLLLEHCVHHKPPSSTSFRLGFAGAPGAGKSTLIEALGKYILQLNAENKVDARIESDQEQSSSPPLWSSNKLAVLCIDPSSVRSGGSILGDKTRMQELSRHPRAFIRPAPTSGTLGGLSEASPEIIMLCQVADYDLVIVETVGVGQSEIELEECVDCMVLALPPAGGDSLQGVKKGIMEACHFIVVTKADGNLLAAAKSTAAEYKGALPFLDTYNTKADRPKVLLASSVTGQGLEELWSEICQFRAHRMETGKLEERRKEQATYWMWKHLQTLVLRRTKHDANLKQRADELNRQLEAGRMTPRVAAQVLLESLQRSH
jgi:LAO/AO transport system kinase